jgi:formylglycine-generating enzyme required for sulfatase activity
MELKKIFLTQLISYIFYNKIFGYIAIITFFFLSNFVANANNIQINTVYLSDKNTTLDFQIVNFNLSWENSWRTTTGPSNWDAAWIFVKYRVSGGDWQHAKLNSGLNQTAPSGATIDVPSDGIGAFIYRSVPGSGTFSLNNVKLRWNYGQNSVADNALVEIKVFAIEMVYVPQSSFFLGTSINEGKSFRDGSWVSGATIPFQISSEASLILGNQAGNLAWGDPIISASLSMSYPKGYSAFYSMKYEITQGQYRDFLNLLTRQQQVSRINTTITVTATSTTNRYVMCNSTTPRSNDRNGIRVPATFDANSPITFYCDLDVDDVPNESVDGEWIACNYLNWLDGLAYLDWSGLRPMTEMEFEKACRGDQNPISGEFAWGTDVISDATTFINQGTNNETTGIIGANTVYWSSTTSTGPIRVGAFAGMATNRQQAGATYYGIMEMSGNLTEQVITVGNPTGQSFTAINGDGVLSATGVSNQTSWPTSVTGGGSKGGSSFTRKEGLRVSDRSLATTVYSPRYPSYGFRGVRRL